jgi:hypothetical protein
MTRLGIALPENEAFSISGELRIPRHPNQTQIWDTQTISPAD